MAGKLKTEVHLNTPGADIELELTPEQSVKLLERLYSGDTVSLNLRTPVGTNGHRAENPAAYAQ